MAGRSGGILLNFVNWLTYLNVDLLLCASGSDIAIDRGTYAAFWDVVGVMHDVSGQAKVTDLHKFALTDQHISGCEVTMDTLWRNSAEYCPHTWDQHPADLKSC